MLDNWGYRHTLRICTYSSFCTATMVPRTLLSTTFIRTLTVLFILSSYHSTLYSVVKENRQILLLIKNGSPVYATFAPTFLFSFGRTTTTVTIETKTEIKENILLIAERRREVPGINEILITWSSRSSHGLLQAFRAEPLAWPTFCSKQRRKYDR